ncbi:hypothetical protein [Bradyrhizobium acaciae]|uniref:hypothetical protein n=1 Tax=Bradyrhizobium acaciae TaxID=2683706 RepID=UPI001E481DD6|nr:hypothetical protein [Bradyrhizobium acaciae]MCC8978552.1 hypothetical protein [Bradyrhizobium acaciae]
MHRRAQAFKLNQSTYPDISDILRRKAEGQRDIIALSFGEKIEMLEIMRDRISPLRDARENRIADRSHPAVWVER